mmetsp:Transcript_16214/g.39951  ORF Transcript_16214/g.39951 Transcript_16214/m.39951 type:complete len:216 (+) Transcript_16214:599-1246(+)
MLSIRTSITWRSLEDTTLNRYFRVSGASVALFKRSRSCSPSSSRTFKQTSKDSPTAGILPNRTVTNPAIVSDEPLGMSQPSASSTTSIGLSPFTCHMPSPHLTTPLASKGLPMSVSSNISPTISSRTSSSVTPPAPPPYSFTTTAMWNLRVWNSCSSFLTIIDSGTKKGGWTMMCRTFALFRICMGLSAKFSRSLVKATPTRLSMRSEKTGSRLY